MSEDKRIYTHLSFKIGTIFILVIILLAVFAGFKAASFFYKNKQPEITAAYISERINNVSELTTAEMLYSGLVIYSEGDIPLITKKGFSIYMLPQFLIPESDILKIGEKKYYKYMSFGMPQKIYPIKNPIEAVKEFVLARATNAVLRQLGL